MRKAGIGMACAAALIGALVCAEAAGGGPSPRCTGSFAVGRHRLAVTLENFRKAAPGLPRTEVLALVNSSFSPDALAAGGWRLVSRIGDVVTLEGSAASAPYLGACAGIRYVKMPSRVYPLMDSVRKQTRTDEVHGTRPGGIGRRLRGKGVLFGIIDTEFDTRQPAFLDSLGQTRFVALWDQTDTAKGYPNRYGYGVIKNRGELLNDSLFGLAGPGTDFHGTTMASYAVGGDMAHPYYGAAPAASIAAVKMSESDSRIVDGLRWLFRIADSLGMPCVVNMSLGVSDGPHDGTSLVDRTIDSLSGAGHIVVGAMGNDADKKAHVTFAVGKGQSKSTWISGETSGAKTYSGVDMWGERGKTMNVVFSILDTVKMTFDQASISITTLITAQYTPDTLYFTNSVTQKKDTAIIQIMVERASPLNGKPHLQAIMTASSTLLRLGVAVSVAGAAGGTVQAWNVFKKPFTSFAMANYLDGDTVMSVNELGGTAKRNIAVGAYISKARYTLWSGRVINWGEDSTNPHPLTGYTSRGPTADGRVKPDITAPGSDIFGAMARNLKDSSGIVLWPDTRSNYGRYWAAGGTSVASPIAAGIIALMLEADRTLTPERVRQILQSTAITDLSTGPITAPNNLWGAGKIDALGAVAQVLGIQVAARRSLEFGRSASATLVRLSGERLRFVDSSRPGNDGVRIDIFSLGGRLIRRIMLGRDNSDFTCADLPSGAYLVRAAQSGRTLCLLPVTLAR